MGFGVTELLIILAIVLVLFGAKKLRNIGGDVGGAIKNFKTAMNEDEKKETEKAENTAEPLKKESADTATIEGTVESSTTDTSKTV